MKYTIATFALIFTTLPLQAGDWPQFRGPGGAAFSDETNLPEKWSATENIRWKADLPGRGLSCPVIADGRIYVTASSGWQQERLHVLCFEQATGKKLWERQFWATGSTACHPKTCMAAPTPVTDGKHVYALFATCDLACLDTEGNLVWYRSLARDYPTITNQVGMAGSPVLAKDVLVMLLVNAGESFALGVDKQTGKNRWKFDRERAINWTTPLVMKNAGQEEVLLQSPKELIAVDPSTGTRRWAYQTKGIADTPSPVAANGLVLLPAAELMALKPRSDGATPEVAWTAAKLKPATASPIFYRDRVYSVTGGGVLACADAADGKLLWQQRVKAPISSSPVIADGKLYVVSEDGTTSVVKLGEKPELLGTNALGETILATPALSNGAIFLRSDAHLFCIGEKK